MVVGGVDHVDNRHLCTSRRAAASLALWRSGPFAGDACGRGIGAHTQLTGPLPVVRSSTRVVHRFPQAGVDKPSSQAWRWRLGHPASVDNR